LGKTVKEVPFLPLFFFFFYPPTPLAGGERCTLKVRGDLATPRAAGRCSSRGRSYRRS